MQENNCKTSQAQRRASSRYIAEKTEDVRAHLPIGYNQKLNKIAEKRGCSKAQVLKSMIDTTYSSEFDNE